MLKIKELIRELLWYNWNAEVTLPSSEEICISYICESVDGKEFDKHNTPIVFIEPTDGSE